ncbi:MAG: aminobenzoyl-glutamate transporter [Gemmatales bacterium]|nr:MAG: aminobenzoyl-glutamate transporter [Gemmatales bacterium]
MSEPASDIGPASNPSAGWTARFLDLVEWAGNKLPDPAMLFVWALVFTWIISALLAPVEFTEIDPRTRKVDPETGAVSQQPIRIQNQLSGEALVTFLTKMVATFTGFHPLGVVLVALLGVGVAEHTGFINAMIKGLLSITPMRLLTPMLILVAIVSHSAGDTGYVLVIPLGGVIFAAAGRHPVAGIVCAFAGVSGGFSANFIPSGLDPLLQGFTQSAAQIIDPERTVNPMCNWFFMSVSCLIIVGVGWYLTDRIVEPRLQSVAIDGDDAEAPGMGELSREERRGLWAGVGTMLAGILLLVALVLPRDSLLRSPSGDIETSDAPLMKAIVPLIFLFFLVPGIVYGYVARTVSNHRDIIKGMSNAMSTMGYYLVMAFCAAQFIYSFNQSGLGALLAIKGAAFLEKLGLPDQITIVGIILLTALVNLLVGSASAKWALLGPIFVPMLMQLGFSPELTQAAYRIGDSSTNIITPLMPYFPLIVVYCQRYVKNTGIGTLIALMLPYSMSFLMTWVLLLLVYWQLGLPLGLQATYTYP